MVINKKQYKEEIDLINQAGIKFNGIVDLSDVAYEIARFRNVNGNIIFYQFTSKSGHNCIRSRINKVFNKQIADVVLWLQDQTKNDHRFKVKNVSDVWDVQTKRNHMLGLKK